MLAIPNDFGRTQLPKYLFNLHVTVPMRENSVRLQTAPTGPGEINITELIN